MVDERDDEIEVVNVKIQLFMDPQEHSEQSRERETWQGILPMDRQFVVEVYERTETNCYVWVDSCQIEEVVFLVHYEDCKTASAGIVSGMSDTYFVRHMCRFSSVR